MKVGIDTVALYTARYALDLATLGEARGIDPGKYMTGLGQYTMSVPPPGEDIVTMAANAGLQALQGIDVSEIDMLLFATESGIDQSKSAGMYVHRLLGLSTHCRVVEFKQACYAGTAAIQLALPYLRENPTKKVLVIASDIARYGLKTTGESSQGCAAAAIVLSANPRVLAIEPEFGVAAEDVMDFWRPNYLHEALVEGKYSSKLYLTMLEKSWEQYAAKSQRGFSDHAYFCYHVPVPRLVEKAHHSLVKLTGVNLPEETWMKQIESGLQYGRQIGNSYTAALYVALTSLLDNTEEDLTHKRIGFYSYGSGCVAEYFSGVVQPGYRAALHTAYHKELLVSRKKLNYDEYEALFNFNYPEDGSHQDIPVYATGSYRLTKFEQHKRIYENVLPHCHPSESWDPSQQGATAAMGPRLRGDDNGDFVMRVYAPGKVILSGEHSVVYGQPALAMAVNRYATATITREKQSQVLFDLADLAHRSHLTFGGLRDLKERIKRKYHRFIRGEYTIRDVLQKPFELAQVALGIITDSHQLSLPHGVKIHVQSDIPIGCGMGSSAATIVSVMHAVSSYLQVPISDEALYQLALEAENMQHGNSSGLDLRMAMHGGCVYTHGDQVQSRTVPAFPLYLINTGTPVSSTGQCVEATAAHFKSQQLCQDFGAVTNAMDQAMQQHSFSGMQQAIRDNHQLLVKIGVVPEKVQRFVSEVESIGAAAKICGAGAVLGDQAGAVLVAAEDKSAISLLCARFGYNIIPLSPVTRGVHAA
jgi:hydroxymethylglutaryl-CoA synthase